jgi:hypothetical protein
MLLHEAQLARQESGLPRSLMIWEEKLFYGKRLALLRMMRDITFVATGAVRGLRRAWRSLTGSALTS